MLAAVGDRLWVMVREADWQLVLPSLSTSPYCSQFRELLVMVRLRQLPPVLIPPSVP
jgi:hypothetical protein